MTKRKYIGASLRPKLDDDIEQAITTLDATTKSDIVRQGIRIVLGITSHKVVEVREKRVPLPALFIKKSGG